jgi:hypothetical protein
MGFEDGGTAFARNICEFQSDYTALRLGIQYSSWSPLWEFQIEQLWHIDTLLDNDRETNS